MAEAETYLRTITHPVRRKASSRKRRRLLVVGGLGMALSLAVALVLFALQDQIVFFYSPSEVLNRQVEAGTAIRLGGMVKEGTWTRDSTSNRFVISDGVADVSATYVGALPDLFREGQGVVAEGKLREDGMFEATNVLAKHDEKYMPKEVVNALKASGNWQHGTGGE